MFAGTKHTQQQKHQVSTFPQPPVYESSTYCDNPNMEYQTASEVEGMIVGVSTESWKWNSDKVSTVDDMNEASSVLSSTPPTSMLPGVAGT